MNAEFCFAEVIIGGIRNRGGVQRLTGNTPDFYRHSTPVDSFISVYRFGEDFKVHTAKSKSVSGYRGACKAEGLHFDFDSPHNDLALTEVRSFTEKAMNPKYGLVIDDVRYYFSGNKGFHLFIKTPEVEELPAGEKIPETIKRYCTILAGEYSSFDRSVYDRTRIFRIPNSRHSKTGLFKIPLLAGEVFTLGLDEIKSLAKNQRSILDAGKSFLERMRNGTH
jgi:hypothetical protein